MKSGVSSAEANSPRLGETRFVEMVFPSAANHYGTLFAGNALGLMSKAAFVAATRYARCPLVMATSDKVEFIKPVRVGEIAELIASIERVGQSSMTVLVEVMAEALLTGKQRVAVRGCFEMVAVDENGKAVPLPKSIQVSKDATKETAS